MSERTLRISFSDLTHTGQVIASNTFPLGTSLVAAYALAKSSRPLDIELFKYPEDFAEYLQKGLPDIACFSNFSWNVRLSTHFALELKRRNPQIITVFGGPNYPLSEDEQSAFLHAHPEIDFYVWLEGEVAFLGLLNALHAVEDSAPALKAQRLALPGVHYLAPDGTFIRTPNSARLKDLAEGDSPYQRGMMDKFFDESLIPMIQTNRGCPFQCTFCTEGQDYYNKVNRSSRSRVDVDLHYISERVKVPDLIIVDSNFGMFQEDLDTCRTLAALQDATGWPKHIHVSAGKNRKERVLEAASIVRGAINLSATIQSIDEHVLDLVKRKNIALNEIIDVGKQAERLGANSYSEIILCLPGDTLVSHYRSVFTMIDVGINFLRMYQLMMLPGSDLSSQVSRQKHDMLTRFRVLPRCFGEYQMLGEAQPVFEIEEICVQNNTMPYADYLTCRELNLTAELFYNSSTFRELMAFLTLKGIKSSSLVEASHEARMRTPELATVYEGFRNETHTSLWETRSELEQFLAAPGVVRRYIDGELGSNELFKYRAMGFFHTQEALHRTIFDAARGLLETQAGLSALEDQFLQELERYCLLRKVDMLDTQKGFEQTFAFDFPGLESVSFQAHPEAFHRPTHLRFEHVGEQKELIGSYIRQYGTTLNGLGRILLRSHVNKLYRHASVAGERTQELAQSA